MSAIENTAADMNSIVEVILDKKIYIFETIFITGF